MGIGLNINYPSPKLHKAAEITPTTWKKHAVVSASRTSACNDQHWDFCYETLQKVSRTFSGVTMQLSQPKLRDAVCITYM